MAANSLLAGAVQILCVIAWRGDKGANAELLAKSLNSNPVVVRRILKALESQGLVAIRPGRYGGVELLRSPAEITLEDVYKAVEPDGTLFALRERGNSRCPVNNTMVRSLPTLFDAANVAVDNVLRRTRIANLVEKIN
jgi:DNA-binding IscR family transcriptional regulator